MDLAALLAPYATLSEAQLGQVSTYLDLLTRWNTRINLTAVRRPEDMVARHFGESFFAARHLLTPASRLRVIDVGSGAGFPGLPLKICAPHITLTLIESHGKKATFLREVIRALGLHHVEVFAARAETYTGPPGDLVTLRAVERFAAALPVAADLVAPAGRLALLVGHAQVTAARAALAEFTFQPPIPLPGSTQRCLLVASRRGEDEPVQ